MNKLKYNVDMNNVVSNGNNNYSILIIKWIIIVWKPQMDNIENIVDTITLLLLIM